MLKKTRHKSFHTTQYDLNPPKVATQHSADTGFHTTQYDLNKQWDKTRREVNKFPYYIVRFKLFLCSLSPQKFFQFPYYIVRFKLNVLTFRRKVFLCFHTTQYDLNIFPCLCFCNYNQFPYYIVRFKRKIRWCSISWRTQFPYYIVRFKPNIALSLQLSVYGFHTTQYDLNYRRKKNAKYMRNSFHTTQYDLNRTVVKWYRKYRESFHTTQYDLNRLAILWA